MLAKWLLAAALMGGLTTSSPAVTAPAEPVAPASSVHLEIRGRLHVLVLEGEDFGPYRRRLPGRTLYEIEADGQRFQLDVNRFAADADGMYGQLVIVTGTLDGDTVHVTGLTVPRDDALIKYVHVTVIGYLSPPVPRDFPPFDQPGGWYVRAGNRTFVVNFANGKVAAEAVKLQGQMVVLSGDLKNGCILANGVEPGPVFRVMPVPLPEPIVR